jgi:hypothetical protein
VKPKIIVSSNGEDKKHNSGGRNLLDRGYLEDWEGDWRTILKCILREQVIKL